jgi:ribonuclease HI
MSKSASKNHRKKLIIIYTDGSCAGNGRKDAVGGIGIHFPNGELKDVSKVYRLGLCSNQKTELYAILTAIRYVKAGFDLESTQILIKTDSEYSINCITNWVYKWVKNDWMTTTNKPVTNRELIEPIYKYCQKYDINFEHVDAHTDGDDADSNGNRVADSLATRATQRATPKVAATTPRAAPYPRQYGKPHYREEDIIVELLPSKK